MQNNSPTPSKGLTWKSVLAIGIVAIFLVVVANSLGLFAKVGVNFGIVNFEIGPNPTSQAPSSLPQPSANTGSQNQNLPVQQSASTGCPYVATGFELAYANTWYGPFSNGYYAAYASTGGFGIWNGYQETTFPDPGGRVQRNLWFKLQGTGMSICVDSSNRVYAKVD